MNKPRPPARPLSDAAGRLLAGSFAKQGFASAELITRWSEIAGADIAVCAEPFKIQWPRRVADEEDLEPGTLVLRVSGPAALEIQHMAPVILERVNRYFGWQAVGRIAIRQAPLGRRAGPARARAPDPAACAQLAGTMPQIADEGLKQALARLGVAVKGK